MEIKSVALIGLGAVGSSYARLLYEGLGENFAVIADGERKTRLERDGRSVDGRRIQFPVIDPKNTDFAPDLIIFAVKALQFEAALELIAPIVGPDTLLMSILNGLSTEELLKARYGEERMLLAKTTISAGRDDSGVQVFNIGLIRFGERVNKVRSGRVQAIAGMFERCNVPYDIPEDMVRVMWHKFMVNIGMNQMSAILRAPFGLFAQVPEAMDLVAMAMREVVMVAQAEGVGLSEADIENYKRNFALPATGCTSTLQDVRAGRPLEVELFAGELLRRATAHGLQLPINELVYRMLTSIDKASRISVSAGGSKQD